MNRPIALDTMKAVAEQIDSYSKYTGTRPKSKSDGLILLDFLRFVFEHNHICIRDHRLQDHEIRQLVVNEFKAPHYADESRRFISGWRNMFNSGRLHRHTKTVRDFVAYRVNSNMQFTKSTGDKPLTLNQLCSDYSSHGFNLPKELINEVKSYQTETSR